MSKLYFLFWFLQLCIGGVVGVSTSKQPSSLRPGLAMTLLFGTLAIVELLVVNELRHNLRSGNIVADVLGGLGFAFPFWTFCLLFACLGYWSAFWISFRLQVDGGHFGKMAFLSFVAIYAVVAAIGRTM